MASPNGTLPAYWQLLRTNRNLRWLWLAQVVSEIGDWLYSLTIYSLLLTLTGSARAVATAVVLQLLPQVFVGPLAGVINDRVSRKKVMIAADLARAVIISGMLWAGRTGNIAAIYLLLCLETVMWAFFEPGRTAVLPNLTTTDDETALASSLSSTTWSVNFSIGSALGGLVGVSFGNETVFVINTASFLVSAFCISRMKFVEPHAADQPPFRARDLVDFTPYLDGWRYIRRDPRLIATLMVKAAFGALGAHWVILPLFGERVFPVHRPRYTPEQAGLLGMSILTTARGVGAMIGPVSASSWAKGDQRRLRLLIGYGFAVLGLGYLSLSVAPNLVWACLALIVLAVGASTAWTFATTLLQLQTEDRFRGRVFSTDFSLLLFNMSIVSYIAGVLIDKHVAPRTLALATGIAAFVPAFLWWQVQRLWRGQPVNTAS